MRRRSLYSLLALGLGITLFLITYTTVYSTTSVSKTSFFSSRPRRNCSPKSYANGKWVPSPRTERTRMASREDALGFAGFHQACASSREIYWHLGADSETLWYRFPEVNSWRWEPDEKDCEIHAMQQADLVRELVEGGGWLLIGDSITEGHFFSLSCVLAPHVRATPNYLENPYFDRAWPQNLYLDPDSPLISELTFPKGFSIAETPLVTFRRVDLLFEKHQLVELHREMYSEAANFSLFSDEAVWTLDPAEYLGLFTAPLPRGNYKTMVSTAGHWTTGLFSGYRNESGIAGVIGFFGHAMRKWATSVQEVLTAENRQRQVVVRAYLPGHEDCHDESEPWAEVKPFAWNWWNWGNIWEFNEVFEYYRTRKYPNIHYLAIDRPARLRPDAHTTSDCLHIIAGAGVLEGWSHYIWHFVSWEA
ncbi:hypothetical protein C8R46DRAFT_1325242, partial [Mycena filopes]